MEKEITLNDIAIRAKSKKEVYQVLTIEGGLYLPPMADANKKYIQILWKDIMFFPVPPQPPVGGGVQETKTFLYSPPPPK